MNTATFIVSFITIAALIVFRIVDRKWLRKLKVPCPSYNRNNKSWSKKKIRWPMPLPSQLIAVRSLSVCKFLTSYIVKTEIETYMYMGDEGRGIGQEKRMVNIIRI